MTNNALCTAPNCGEMRDSINHLTPAQHTRHDAEQGIFTPCEIPGLHHPFTSASPAPAAHDHVWQPAGVSPVGNARGSMYIWLACACGEIEPRQWDFE